jgi:uncharacterized membrane protein
LLDGARLTACFDDRLAHLLQRGVQLGDIDVEIIRNLIGQ